MTRANHDDQSNAKSVQPVQVNLVGMKMIAKHAQAIIGHWQVRLRVPNVHVRMGLVTKKRKTVHASRVPVRMAGRAPIVTGAHLSNIMGVNALLSNV